VSSVDKEFKQKLPRLVSNIALASIFGAIGILSSIVLAGIFEGADFYSWLIFTLVGGAFLVRALVDVLAISDRTIDLFLKRLGIQYWSKRRMAKDLMCIIAVILVAAAIFPLFEAIGPTGTIVQLVATAIAIGIVFLFVYDITLTLYRMLQVKARIILIQLVQKPTKETK
jgi:hypothetical protein